LAFSFGRPVQADGSIGPGETVAAEAQGASIERAVIDKNARIGKGGVIRSTSIPDGTVI
jgi:hypothetical protein